MTADPLARFLSAARGDGRSGLSGGQRAPLAPSVTWRLRALLLGLLLVLVGCRGDGASVPLPSWVLHASGEPARQLTLPAHVDDKLPVGARTFHLTATVDLPDNLRGRALTLVVHHLWSNTSLVVDGRAMVPMTPNAPGSYRPRGAHGFPIPADLTRAARITLDLTVDYEWTQGAWLDTVPCLTDAAGGGDRYEAIQVVSEYGNILAAGSVLTISFAYGVLFLLDRRRAAHGWFALQGSAASTYCFFCSGLTQDLFGHYDAGVLPLALVLAIFVSLRFTRTQFALPRPSRSTVAVEAALVGLFALAVLRWGGPFSATRLLGPPAVLIIGIGIAVQVYTTSRLALRRDPPLNASVVVVAWILLAVFNASDLVAWVGLGNHLGGFRIGCIGIACFSLLQSVALSRDFIRSLGETDRLNDALQAQVGRLAEQTSTVAQLNEELRRQVLARSEQLSDALVRLASAQGEPVVLQEADVVEGRYTVVRVIGAGGMGVVYEVQRIGDGARLALKVLSGTVGVREMARFAREARLAAAVSHPNVVKILDVAVSKSGFLFLVLEFVDGLPLHKRRERYGDARWAFAVLHRIAAGLEAIHAQGIVHRDLKPANILTCEDALGSPLAVKITDFGISNLAAAASTPDSKVLRTPSSALLPRSPASLSVDDDPTASFALAPRREEATPLPTPASSGSLTQTGAVLGTPAYMAPEALRDPRSVAASADVYSFGVLAFELIGGRRPFNETEAMARAFGYMQMDLPSLQVNGVPAELVQPLVAALSVDPLQRPTVAALTRALTAASLALDAAALSRPIAPGQRL